MNNELVMHNSVNPEMIILARESRALTQTELAGKVSLTQAEISRYESGVRNITSDHLQKIASVLRYPTTFFFQPGSRYGLGSSGLHHRKRKVLSSRILDMFIAKINILRLMSHRLLAGIEIDHDQKFPQYDVDEFRGDIESIAEHVRAAWRLPSGPVKDLIGAVENAGGIVHRTSFGTQKIDALAQWVPPAPPIILVNADSPGDRLRFTLAHEIAHLVMHDVPRDHMEEEADAFASALLMPARDLAPALSRVTLPQLAQLKPYWRVSIAALIRRAHDLGKISDRQYRSLYEEMSKLGYRTQEPLPISVERPTLLKEIIDTHLDELGYNVPELATMLALEEEDFRSEFLVQNHLRLMPSSGTQPKKQIKPNSN